MTILAIQLQFHMWYDLWFGQSKYEEKFVGGPEDVKALQEQEHHEKHQHPKLIVRGIKYYKSEPVDETEAEENSK